jgi:hypothetical protein
MRENSNVSYATLRMTQLARVLLSDACSGVNKMRTNFREFQMSNFQYPMKTLKFQVAE